MTYLKSFQCFLLISSLLIGCSTRSDSITKEHSPPQPESSPATLGIVGDETDVATETSGGFVLVGGSTDVDEAMAWMIRQSGGGDFVVIRATGTDAYNPYIFRMGGINSVETLKINTVSLANDSLVVQKIRNAEALFIAGGGQSDYVRFWKGSKTQEAINYLINQKKAPVGGTSAGCAILGEFSFSALNGTISSQEALANPYHPNVTLQKGDFIEIPMLANTITDQHYLARNREGRHVVFMARMADETDAAVRGIGVDEKTAVAVDSSGMAIILGSGTALFLEETSPGNDPEVFADEMPLTWNQNNEAIKGYAFKETSSDQPQFDVKKWVATTAKDPFYWYVIEGELKSSAEEAQKMIEYSGTK